MRAAWVRLVQGSLRQHGRQLRLFGEDPRGGMPTPCIFPTVGVALAAAGGHLWGLFARGPQTRGISECGLVWCGMVC